MTAAFIILGLLTVAGAVAAMTSPRLVHCALWLVVANVGLAGLYLWVGAQFVGLVQVLVYVGAVAILIVFAVLLTRGGESPEERTPGLSRVAGVGVAVLVTGGLVATIASSGALGGRKPVAVLPETTGTVRDIGTHLMTDYVLPLEVMAVLLTAALIGAVILALAGAPRAEKGGHR